MKNLKQFLTPTSVTSKVLLFVTKVIVLTIAINLSFWLMDQANTLAFIGGLLLGIGSVGIFLEHIIKRYIKKQ